VQQNVRCLALNGSKIKHISGMKADTKLDTSLFSVVTSSVLFSTWSRLSSSCVCMLLDS
jgi:hypothetical protein